MAVLSLSLDLGNGLVQEHRRGQPYFELHGFFASWIGPIMYSACSG